jgi:hypothetical protein
MANIQQIFELTTFLTKLLKKLLTIRVLIVNLLDKEVIIQVRKLLP